MTDFSKMPINEVANYNTPEALDYFWAHKEFAEYFTPQRMKHYEVVAEYIASVMGCDTPHIIDFGCGCGQMFDELPLCTDHDIRRVGVDYAFSAVQYAQENVNWATFICGDITKPTFPRESYDLALCIEVLEHITEYEAALTEIFRVLKVGGSLVLTVPNGVIDLGAPYHVNFWSQERIVEILAAYGEIIHHEMIMDNNSTLVHVRKVAR